MGLTHPTEPTKLRMYVVYLVARSNGGAPVLDPAEALRRKDEITEEIDLLRRRKRMDHHHVLMVYPDNAADLRTVSPLVWQCAYPDDGQPNSRPTDRPNRGQASMPQVARDSQGEWTSLAGAPQRWPDARRISRLGDGGRADDPIDGDAWRSPRAWSSRSSRFLGRDHAGVRRRRGASAAATRMRSKWRHA